MKGHDFTFTLNTGEWELRGVEDGLQVKAKTQ